MNRKDIHVVMRSGRWAVTREGKGAPISLHDRRDDAVRAAKELAHEDGVEVVVFGLDGRPKRNVSSSNSGA